MTSLNTLLRRGVLAALLGVGAIVATAPAASAYVVCNRDGDCWRADHRYSIPQVYIRFHSDNWNWRRHHDRWHDYDNGGDRGYWDRDHWRHWDRDRDRWDHD
jgi:hypothetical protein